MRLAALCFVSVAIAADPFVVRVIDESTGRGIPLVELRTKSELSQWTDSNGVAAIVEPGLMGQEVWFAFASPGYRLPGEGKPLMVRPGSTETVRMIRANIAEGLYRITGEGIYRDSALAGIAAPLKHPLLNAKVAGQDTVMAAVYRGKIYWFWGDTNRIDRPLGHFATSGATSALPGRGGLDPSLGIDLEYLTGANGFARGVCTFSGPGMKWLFWALPVKDARGRERLVARYRSMKTLGTAIEGGIAVWNDENNAFERYANFEQDLDPRIPAHPFVAEVGGVEYVYVAGPLPDRRARATLLQIADEAQWEGFTPLRAGARYSKDGGTLERSPSGTLVYGWKKNTPPLTFEQQAELVKAGKLTPGEGPYQLRDVLTGTAVKPHAGSVYWNAFRRRWIMIVEEDRGLSDNGEIWYAEGDTPTGPWVYARKVATHPKYTLYNPTQHPFFDQDGGRIIYFEGTYSDFFSGAKQKTPRYDYNQMMYRLALDDPRLGLPAPVYRLRDGRQLMRDAVEAGRLWDAVESIPAFALARPGNGVRPNPQTVLMLDRGAATTPGR